MSAATLIVADVHGERDLLERLGAAVGPYRAADVDHGEQVGLALELLRLARAGSRLDDALLLRARRLWADWAEPKAPNLRQIVGHTVGAEIRRADFGSDGWALCLDLGGGKRGDRLAGALVRDGEVEVVVYDRRQEAAA